MNRTPLRSPAGARAAHVSLALVAAMLLLAPASAHAEGNWKDGDDCGLQGNVVKLHRAAVCSKKFLGVCTSTTQNPQFLHSDGKSHYFDTYSSSTGRDTYIAQFQVPAKQNTDMMVLAFSGQQQHQGVWNRVTGQKEDYKKLFSSGQYWSWYTTHEAGLAESIWANSWISWSNPGRIHVAMSFENSSNWLSSKNQRGRVIDAWVEYIEDHMQGQRKMLTLAGSSRGGCVAYNVALKLKAKAAWEDIPIILLLVDPVCRRDDVEGDADYPKKYNPLNGNWFAWAMDNDNNFTPRARQSMTLFQIATGDKVIIPQARTFVDLAAPSHPAASQTLFERDTIMPNGDRVPFYAHQWVRYSHKFLGRTCRAEDEIADPLTDWWEASASRFYCPGIATFNPDTQFCSCPSGYYWKWSPGPGQFSCVPIPSCAEDEYAAGDPMICHPYCPVACQSPVFTSDGGFRFCSSNCSYGTCNLSTGNCTCASHQYFDGVGCTNYCADPCMKPVWKLNPVPVEPVPALPLSDADKGEVTELEPATAEPADGEGTAEATATETTDKSTDKSAGETVETSSAQNAESTKGESTKEGDTKEATKAELASAIPLLGGLFPRNGFTCVPKCPGDCWKGICALDAAPVDPAPLDPIGPGEPGDPTDPVDPEPADPIDVTKDPKEVLIGETPLPWTSPKVICELTGEPGTTTTCAIRLARDSADTPLPTAAKFELAYDPTLVRIASLPEALALGHRVYTEPGDLAEWDGWGWLKLHHPEDPELPLTTLAAIEGILSGDADLLVFQVQLLQPLESGAPATFSLGQVHVWSADGAELTTKWSGGTLLVGGPLP